MLPSMVEAGALSGPNMAERHALYGGVARGVTDTVRLERHAGLAGFPQTVAIKRLHSNFVKDLEFVAMFTGDARLAARLHPSNVVSLIGVVACLASCCLSRNRLPGSPSALGGFPGTFPTTAEKV